MSSTRSFRKEEIADKTVIDSSGKVIGKVKDLTFTLDSTITLIVERTDGSSLDVPLSKVMGVSDHVVVKQDVLSSVPPRPSTSGVQIPAPSPQAGVMLVCKACGTQAPPGTQWCPGCGRSLT